MWHDRLLPAGTIAELVYTPRPGRLATLRIGETYIYATQWGSWQLATKRKALRKAGRGGRAA